MASGAGPRAKGTDGTDYKFRQRVDDHYKLMADARKELSTVTKLHGAHVLLSGAYFGAAMGGVVPKGPAPPEMAA